MTTLYRYEHMNTLETETTVLAKTPSTITVSITGSFKYFEYAAGVTNYPVALRRSRGILILCRIL